ncbi:amidohydrolase family protein [Fodinibius salsisoli]|uniref:Amidohydrolase family protein n=1 Tax=Fodinibius salsisoli TaxID=2820877 RepID=A0ABT3PTI0_9BACT|nr:amidohydrolase family protein [Fodinibius salsisoli]MCW9709174.1 amidohydrolase family protein [Fodinibius salsisoli]
MKKIDAHQHFWNYDVDKHGWINEEMKKLRRDFMPPDLKKLLDNEKVEGCVAVQADQSEEETRFLLDLQSKYSFIKGVVGWLDIAADSFPKKLEHYSRNPALKGLRHIVQDEPDDRFLLRPNFLKGIQMLDDYGLTYDILIYERQLPATIEFVNHFPGQSFVLDHIGKPKIKAKVIDPWEEGARELAQHDNIYCKISGLVTEADWHNWTAEDLKPYLDIIFDAFGPERLMFGSDWPVCTLAAEYSEVIAGVQEYIKVYSEEEQAMVMGGNTQKFYDL